jgi:aminoglycoside/choline kinase family phosphotransferase
MEALHRALEQLTGRKNPYEVEEMQGGASTRRFFRVHLSEGGSLVAMFVPGKSQEIAKASEEGRRWPFLEVRDLLAARGVRVPHVLAEACDDGILLVQDLGEDTLANYLLRRPESRELLYQTAVRDLALAQKALAELPAGSIVRERAFDHDLLLWEVDHFREWRLSACGIELDAADREVFDRAARHLATTIASWPRGFVHRDYQSRNLMVEEDAAGVPHLVWIDFQDAMLGPRVYDLVALLTDSYQTFTREFIEQRLDEYAGALGLGGAERERIGREFDIVTVQRKLKDAGRFIFVERKNKNPSFLQFVEPTIGKARAALARLRDDPVLRELDTLLDRVLA